MKASYFKMPTLVILAAINCVLPFTWGWASTRFGMTSNFTGMGIAIHEFLASLLSFFLIRAMIVDSPRPWLRGLQWSLLFVAIGDLMYGVTSYILRIPPPRGLIPLVHELPYVLFSGLTAYAVLLRSLQGLSARTRTWVLAAMGIIAVSYFFASYELILSPFFEATPKRPLLIYSTALLYGIGQSLFVSGLLIASVRALSISEFLLWSLFLVMAASDFLLRYQDIGGPISGLSFFEYGWELAFAGITSVLLIEKTQAHKTIRLTDSPAPLHSLRVITAMATLVSLLAFTFAISWFLSFLNVASARNAGVYALVFTLIWSASNVFSIVISQGLRKLHAQLIEHSTIPAGKIPAMAWEVSEIFLYCGRQVGDEEPIRAGDRTGGCLGLTDPFGPALRVRSASGSRCRSGLASRCRPLR